MSSPDPPPPWFLIGKEALRGQSLESLSRRYGVSVEQIENHLKRAIKIAPNGDRTIRSNAEIAKASALARSDLVDILQQAISELVQSDRPRLSQLPEFEKLLVSAARLFQWPTVATRLVATTMQPGSGYGSMAANGTPTSAVNLSLIATSPEELARMAQAQGKFAEPVEEP